MVYKAIPRIVFKNNRLTEGQSLHSVVISLLRGLAAVEVAAAHLRADMYPGLRTVTHPSIWFNGFAFMAGFAHQAVLIFFVISGWLVGGSLLDKRQEPGAFRNYAVDRLTRLWTVLIPTFVVTLLIAMCTGTSTSTDFTFLESLSTSTFVANLFGLQTIAAPPFGENFPLWSLANETWYYVMFALLVATFIARTSWHRLVSGATLLCVSLMLPQPLVCYFAIWLLGVGFSRVKIDCHPAVRCCWLILTVAAWSYYRLTVDLSKFDIGTIFPDILCSVMFLLVLSSIQFKVVPTSVFRGLSKISSFFANFSFSLYVLHIPLMRLIEHWLFKKWGLRQLSPHNPLDFALYLGILATLLAASYVFYRLFEAQTYLIRRFVKHKVQRRAAVGVTSADKA